MLIYYKVWPGFCRKYQESVSEVSAQVFFHVVIPIARKNFFFFFEDLKQKINSILPVYLYLYCKILGKLSKYFSSFVWDHGSQPFTNA